MAPSGDVPERLAAVLSAIARAAERAGRPADDVRLVAVSKTISADVVRQALLAGVTDLGENRVQEAQEKVPLLADLRPRWHLIGHLQSNKAGRALQLFDVIHSVDSVELATLLSRRRVAQGGPPVDVLFEVNVAGEASKQGFAPEQLSAAAPALANLAGLHPLGLMTVAPAVADPEEVRPVFRRLRHLRDQLAGSLGEECRGLSMGMSHDFVVAIEEGATIVRVGTAIFGRRTARLEFQAQFHLPDRLAKAVAAQRRDQPCRFRLVEQRHMPAGGCGRADQMREYRPDDSGHVFLSGADVVQGYCAVARAMQGDADGP